MKKLMAVMILMGSISSLSYATSVTVDYSQYPQCSGSDCGVIVSGSQSHVTLTPEPLQTIINQENIVVPATVGSGVNGAVPNTVGNLNFVGTGLTSSVSGSGSTATSNVNFSNLSTVEGQTNATNISNVSNSLNTTNANVTTLNNTVNNNSTDISGLQTTVANHTTQINQNTSDISSLNNTVVNHTAQINTLNTNVSNLAGGLGAEQTARIAGDAANSTAITNETNRATSVEGGIQNLTDGSVLSNTVNQHTTQINSNTAGIAAINNMSDPSTVLNQTVNGNTTAISNETSRATGAETALTNGLSNETATRSAADTTLQSNINSESNVRASADQALQNQINSVNAQTQDNTDRIDRLEQTKYLLEPVVRLYDDKHFQVQAFDSYDVRHGMNSALGMRVMFKVGPSYEEKLLKRTNPEIARLLAANVNNDIEERNAIRKQLAEDKALISEQAALLKQLSQSNNVVLSANVYKVSPSNVLPSKDDDFLKSLDERNEAFAASK